MSDHMHQPDTLSDGGEVGTRRVIAGRFELLHRAGEGGMGLVYAATDRQTGDRVAIKVMHAHLGEEVARRFEREAETLDQLAHPGIVRYVAHGQDAGHTFLAMEWLEGEDLATYLLREGPPAVPEALEILRRVAVPLAYAHEVGLVHRDVKPANVFIVGGDLTTLKLLDFGIARFENSLPQTQTGVAVGTPHYMAPEQARGLQSVDARADVYSLGAMLFELLTGRPPFLGEHGLAVLMMALFEAPPSVNELRGIGYHVPAELESLVHRMLAKERLERPIDARAVAAELDALGRVEGDAAQASVEASAPRAALTADELRIVSVVAAAGPALAATSETPLEQAPDTAAPGALTAELMATLVDAVAGYGAQLEQLADGTLVAMVVSGGMPTEQAISAARCALAMREVRPNVPMVVATGRSRASGSGAQPVGEVIERAVATLFGTAPGTVQIDDVTAGLLPGRFEVRSDGARMTLVTENDPAVEVRTVLGKPTPCVGRRRELAQLEAVYADCVEEEAPAAVLVMGPPGIGKTRLSVEFLRRLRSDTDEGPGFEFIYGRAESFGGGGAYGLIGSALRRFIGIRTSDTLDVRRHKVKTRIGRHLLPAAQHRVALFIGEALGIPFDDEGEIELAAARRDGRLMADQVRLAFVTWLRSEAWERPVVFLLEDLQWGDRPSLNLIDAALELESLPLLVLATARPELEVRVPTLWESRDVTQISLRPLTSRAASNLVDHVLGEEIADAARDRLVRQADGNAFFLEELIRAHAQGDGTDALPESVLGMVEARLSGLPSSSRLVLRAASVFGESFKAEAVSELCGSALSSDALNRELDSLREQELLLSRDDGPASLSGRFRFRSAVLREAAYKMLTDRDRRLGHKLAGEYLSRRGAGDALALGQHFLRGGDQASALPHMARAAKVALDANDFGGAYERAQLGIQCGAEGALLGELLLMQSESKLFQGDLEASSEHASGVIEHCEAATAEWFRAVGYAVFASSLTGREDALHRWIELLYDTPSTEPDVALPHVIALLQAAVALNQRGQYHDAHAIMILAQRRAESVPDVDRPLLMGRMEGMRGILALSDGDLASASEHYRRSAQAYASCGNHRRACNMRISLGFTNMRLGLFKEADMELEEAGSRAAQMGLRHVAAVAWHNLGLTRALTGRVRAGLELELKAYAALKEEGDVRVSGTSLVYLAQIRMLAQDWEGAESHARQAVDELEAFPPARAMAWAVLSMALLEQEKRQKEALFAAREGYQALEELGTIEEGEGVIWIAHARALMANDKRGEARLVLMRAIASLTEQSIKISDVEMRRRYLEAVPEHRQLMELAQSIS